MVRRSWVEETNSGFKKGSPIEKDWVASRKVRVKEAVTVSKSLPSLFKRDQFVKYKRHFKKKP